MCFCPTDDDDDEDSCFIERDMIISDEEELYEYELIGVTVHTGTADGGHYYSFIRDRLNKSESGQDKWYVFLCLHTVERINLLQLCTILPNILQYGIKMIADDKILDWSKLKQSAEDNF